jgi:ATPase family associated with various cellular activities (AAA)
MPLPEANPVVTPPPAYPFFSELARVLNSGMSRSVLLTGNIQDLFYVDSNTGGDYSPLIDFITKKSAVPGIILLVYELNGPIRAYPGNAWETIKRGWITWKTGTDPESLTLQALTDRKKQIEKQQVEADFDSNFSQAVGQPTVALELLRQLTICSRSVDSQGRPFIKDKLMMVVESMDLIVPGTDPDIAKLNAADRHRVMVLSDWFSDPGFTNGGDSIVMLAESRSMVHPRVARLPSVLSIDIPRPDSAARQHYIDHFIAQRTGQQKPAPQLYGTSKELADLTAGLSIHALRQALLSATHTGKRLEIADVNDAVEDFISSQLGDDVIEFKRPTHTLKDVVGFKVLKEFLKNEMLPRMTSTGADALSGAAVAGPIGGGKTFIFEAAAAELGIPVLTLKNIRSQWFGQTDVIFEQLRRTLESLGRLLIFVDEADTQFGGVGNDAHETERRLTGKIQQMMSDVKLRGKVTWLLMTARIQNLSPDIRRPGRAGDLIIPVLDPEGQDRKDFIQWMLKDSVEGETDKLVEEFEPMCVDYSSATYASLRSVLKARAKSGKLTPKQVKSVMNDVLQPDIRATRRYQTLQALVNCTRRSLLPDPNVTDETRARWMAEISTMEIRGLK